MRRLSEENGLRQAVLAAASRPDVREAVGRVYADLQARTDERRPACAASGACCRFEEYGHRLFVTTIELAAFVHHLRTIPTAEVTRAAVPGWRSLPVLGHKSNASLPAWDGRGCPFQENGRCGVHAIRPFGCRTFFCDATSTEWQHQTYEHFHAELKRLHERLDVPYSYVEWREALRALGLTGVGEATAR